MSVTINQMRVDISNVYPYSLSKKWKDKVLHQMPDKQIMAMHKNFEAQGKFTESERKRNYDRLRDGVKMRMDI